MHGSPLPEACGSSSSLGLPHPSLSQVGCLAMICDSYITVQLSAEAVAVAHGVYSVPQTRMTGLPLGGGQPTLSVWEQCCPGPRRGGTVARYLQHASA